MAGYYKLSNTHSEEYDSIILRLSVVHLSTTKNISCLQRLKIQQRVKKKKKP